MLDYRIKQFKRQLQESRYRLHKMYEELAAPLYDMLFVATKDVWRISTNGSCIYFDPDWLKNLREPELDFILSHVLMHIKLGHIERPAYYYGDRYHLAADIVANGKLHTYGWAQEKIPHIGTIRYQTYFPTVNGEDIESFEAVKYVPIDPSTYPPTKRRQFMIDSDQWWDKQYDRGECGTIVLGPNDIDPENLEYYGPSFGSAFKYKKEIIPKHGEGGPAAPALPPDNQPQPVERSENNILRAIHMLRQEMPSHIIGEDSGMVDRAWGSTNAPILDWRNLLHRFVQEEINDYSFTPPDKRFQDGDFFLPDYNVYQETVRDVYFMVDTSGSISDEMLCLAYAEIKQALVQFNGALRGVVVFFDTRIYKTIPFNSIDDIRKMKPFGGGGTDYGCLFRFVQRIAARHIPTSIVIITDGEGTYPSGADLGNIPVLWLITGKVTPSWNNTAFVRCV